MEHAAVAGIGYGHHHPVAPYGHVPYHGVVNEAALVLVLFVLLVIILRAGWI